MPAGIHIAQVGIHHDLKEHAGVIAAGAATLVSGFYFADVKPVKDVAHDTYGVVGGNKFAQ